MLLYCLLDVTTRPQLMNSLTNRKLVLRGLISQLPSPQALSSSLTRSPIRQMKSALSYPHRLSCSQLDPHPPPANREQRFSSESVHRSERQLQQIFVGTCNIHLTVVLQFWTIFKICMPTYLISIDASALLLNSRISFSISAVKAECHKPID